MPHPFHACQPPVLEDDASETWWLLKSAYPTRGKAKAHAAKEGGWRFTDMRCRSVWLRPQMGLDGDGYCWTFTFAGDPHGKEFWQVESLYAVVREHGNVIGLRHRNDVSRSHWLTPLADLTF